MDSAAPADAALELRAEEEGAAKLRAEVDAEVASMSAAALGGVPRSTLANGCAVSVSDRFLLVFMGTRLPGSTRTMDMVEVVSYSNGGCRPGQCPSTCRTRRRALRRARRSPTR